jgi:hypothetical protein
MANGNGNGRSQVPMLYSNVDPRLARFLIAPEECLPPGELPADVAMRPWLSDPVHVAPVEGLPVGTAPPLFFPPWLYPPFGVRPVDEPQVISGVIVAAAGTASFAFPVVPPGRIGVVDRIGVDSSDFGALVVFQTRLNATPIPPWSARSGNSGTIFDPPKLAAPICIPPGQVFDVFVTNGSAGNVTLRVRILGWMY